MLVNFDLAVDQLRKLPCEHITFPRDTPDEKDISILKFTEK